jgi:hypothetical protein
LDKIGTAEMENEIVKNILAVTKKQSMQSAEQTGVGSSFEDEDIRVFGSSGERDQENKMTKQK